MHLPGNLTESDWESSATVRDVEQLERALGKIDGSPRSLVDLGCGYGGLTRYIADRYGMTDVYGFDRDEERLHVAAERGITVQSLDLEHGRYPLEDDSVDMALSFGAFEHFVWYDNIVSEASRILRPGGWFIISKPNLGSYLNRAALLLGFQPRDIEVSQEVLVGALPGYHTGPLAHVHSATLRAMRELLKHYGFTVRTTRGFSPDFGSRPVRAADAIFGRFPSIARRYIIVAQS